MGQVWAVKWMKGMPGDPYWEFERMPEPDAYLAYYLVLVTDVLGQRSLLRELRQLPQSPEEIQKAMEILRQTVGYLTTLREGFQGVINGWSEPSSVLDQSPAHVRDFIARACSCEITYRHFSDSIIVSVCLSDTGHETSHPVMGVFGALVAASCMHLLALSVERPTRSGIDVGLAMQIPPENDIYGPALERAVRLESEDAEYPRIAVGHELVQYLTEVASRRPVSPFDIVAAQGALSCQNLIFNDSDGKLALDFLGEEMFKHATQGLIETIPKAYQFVRTAQLRWRDQGNSKLAPRYDRLWDYFRSRAHIWGEKIKNLSEELERGG
jgi:hypothetical protein